MSSESDDARKIAAPTNILWLLDPAKGDRFDKAALRLTNLPPQQMGKLRVDHDPERCLDNARGRCHPW